MGVIGRITERLLTSDVPLERGALLAEATALLAAEAPLAPREAASRAVDALLGFGPLSGVLNDAEVSDVLVNAPDEIWVERSGVLERLVDVRFESGAHVRATVERVIAPLGLRLDRASPAVNARLPDGSRLHAAMPPIAIDGTIVAIRRFTPVVTSMERLVEVGSVDSTGAGLLLAAVEGRSNVLVSGGTGAGKTTMLNVLSAAIPGSERVVTVEDAAELRLAGHVVRLEAREANADGVGAVPVELLVRHALRLRPDRIVVGEVRGPEALDMLQAMNSGHDGSMSTVHANGPEEALWRLETLALSGRRRLAAETVRRQLHSAIDLVVHVERSHGRRRVSSISNVSEHIEEVWAWS